MIIQPEKCALHAEIILEFKYYALHVIWGTLGVFALFKTPLFKNNNFDTKSRLVKDRMDHDVTEQKEQENEGREIHQQQC